MRKLSTISVLLFSLLNVSGHLASSEATMRVTQLDSMPALVRLAINESEGFTFLIETNGNSEIEVDFDESPAKGLKLQLYRVEKVSMESGKAIPDPMIPLTPMNRLTVVGKQHFYIKLTALSFATPGKSMVSIIFRNRYDAEKVELKFQVEILPIILTSEIPVTLQATVWEWPGWTNNQLKELLSLLSEYRINSLSGLRVTPELVRFVIEDLRFRLICLPPNEMLTPWSNPELVKRYKNRWRSEQVIVSEIKQYLAQFQSILDNPKWTGKLSFQLWDEPREADYPDVILSYKAAKKTAPFLKLELTEQPDQGLQNVTDIWIPYVKYLNPNYVAEQHRLGKEVWFYANQVHGIDHPLFGMRILGWLLWRYNLDGYIFWAINWWKENPWTTVSSQKKDFLKRGTLIYLDQKTGKIYPSLRLEAFRDGIEDMLLLEELEKIAKGDAFSPLDTRTLLNKLRNVYGIAERYDSSQNPANFRNEIIDLIIKANR